NHRVEILDNEPAQAKGGYRLTPVVLCEQPEVVVTEARFFWIEGLVEVNITMGAPDGRISREIAPNVQRYPGLVECCDGAFDRQLNTGGFMRS
ncbi:MAG TPA: hypothetical protein VEQ62_03215, partial [Stellaceae bacterium]|nr:hypothetical protein [Stellaceae bacterium]